MALRNAIRNGAALLIALSIGACGSSGSGGDSTPAARDSVSYAGSTTLTLGVAASIAPTVTGSATVTGWSISPSLPTGLTLASATGVISGTPAMVSPAGNYAVTATYQGGSASTTLTITVDDQPPAIAYPEIAPNPYPSTTQATFTLAALSPIPILTPANTGGAAMSWSVSPALPAGLGLDAATGIISGTPTATSASAAFTITAKNSGGSSTFNLNLAVGTLVLDVGHGAGLVSTHVTATGVLSLDQEDHWVLWDYASGKEIANGYASCIPTSSGGGSPLQVPQSCSPFMGLEGTTLAVQTAEGLEIYSSVDGSLSALIPTPFESQRFTWFALATDGSYICAGSTNGMTMWSPNGTVIGSRSGDYSRAVVFAAPGQVQVALGAAGMNVIETVTVPSGASTVSPSFQGQFSSWFVDGQRFLTTLGGTVRIYSSAAAQQDIASLGTAQDVGGEGTWFWNFVNSELNIYKVGASGSPTATFSAGSIVPSGSTIGVLFGTRALTLIDLSGSSPAATNFSTPASPSAYAAISASQWVAGDGSGALIDGASLSGTPRYFDYGGIESVAGGSQFLALARDSGQVLYYDAGTLAQEGTIDFPATEVALSSDGSVLAAASALALNTYSIPSGTELHSWPIGVVNFNLSGSGTVIGQISASGNPCEMQVSAASGGPVLWSATGDCDEDLLSPDGTWAALGQTGVSFAAGNSPAATTNLYQNGSFVTTVPGEVAGWLDASHILVNSYVQAGNAAVAYSSSSIYDTTGTKIGDVQFPADIHTFQVVGTGSIYDPGSNAVYSTSTGMATWTGSPINWSRFALPNGQLEMGAVAGPNVVALYGSQVIAVPY